MCFTGARCEGSGRDFFMVSYVEKNMAAEEAGSNIAFRTGSIFLLTARSAPDHDTSNTPIYTSKASCLSKALCRLQTGFYRVNWEEQKVYSGSCHSTRLSESTLQFSKIKSGSIQQEIAGWLDSVP
jgi:hypothetical protein